MNAKIAIGTDGGGIDQAFEFGGEDGGNMSNFPVLTGFGNDSGGITQFSTTGNGGVDEYRGNESGGSGSPVLFGIEGGGVDGLRGNGDGGCGAKVYCR